MEAQNEGPLLESEAIFLSLKQTNFQAQLGWKRRGGKGSHLRPSCL